MGTRFLKQLQINAQPGPFHVDKARAVTGPANPKVRLIAYYLPQFHAIAENDAWWGEGFTEWTNVTKALPRYVGHYQPRHPADLGFYDLSTKEALQQQAALAKAHGISGFCIHHYWFAGRRLLETPLNLLLSNPDIDLPFCINWANENWTRRWDGSEQSILLGQDHSPEDDIAFITSLEPAMRDPRYIRVNGRPLLMLYRPGLLPDAAATVARWRRHLQDVGVGDPYVTMPQAFQDIDPRRYGMDAAVGFPPHHSGLDARRETDFVQRLEPVLRGKVIAYDQMAANALLNAPTEFRLHPGVCPMWDNEPRRPNGGTSFAGANPRKYGDWLAAACARELAAPGSAEPIVFINAWNEWAEGAYLEPDRHFGFAYLSETAQVLHDLDDESRMAERLARARSIAGYDGPPMLIRLAGKLRWAARKAAGAAVRFSKVMRSV